jgi:hypothetical protein
MRRGSDGEAEVRGLPASMNESKSVPASPSLTRSGYLLNYTRSLSRAANRESAPLASIRGVWA